MFNKNKVKDTRNEYDYAIVKLINELAEIRMTELSPKAEDVYFKNQTMNFYIEGTDEWMKEFAERTKAQICLINAIEKYDAKRDEIIEFINNHKDQMTMTVADRDTSHECVEAVVRRLTKNF